MVVDFGNILEEVRKKGLKVCFVRGEFFLKQCEDFYMVDVIFKDWKLEELILMGEGVTFHEMPYDFIVRFLDNCTSETWGVNELDSYLDNVVYSMVIDW